jgi:hypothetical protein
MDGRDPDNSERDFEMSLKRLSYEIYSNPTPVQASPQQGTPSLATLTIVISNSTNKVIDCRSISFAFKQGKNAKDLSTDFTGVSTNAATGWNITQSGSVFTAVPESEKDGQVGGQGLTFVLSNIKVNQQPGKTMMTITEVTTNPDNSAEFERRLEKFPTQFSVGPLVANPLTINQGESTTLSWSGSGGATYALQYRDASNNVVNITQTEDGNFLPPVGSYTIRNLQHDTVFYLIVTLQQPGENEPPSFQREVTVTVVEPLVRILSFNANPESVSYQGEEVTLSWQVENATKLILIGVGEVEGESIKCAVNETTTFILEAEGAGGPVTSTRRVEVAAVKINHFDANPSVVYGRNNKVAVKLDWDVQAATLLHLNGSKVTGTGTTRYVNETTNFLLEAKGYPADVSKEAVVMVKDVNLKIWEADKSINVSFMANMGAYKASLTLFYVTIGSQSQVLTYPYNFSVGAPGLTQFSKSLGDIPSITKLVSASVEVLGFPSGPVTATYTPES